MACIHFFTYFYSSYCCFAFGCQTGGSLNLSDLGSIEAILDRLDESVEFGLPDIDARKVGCFQKGVVRWLENSQNFCTLCPNTAKVCK